MDMQCISIKQTQEATMAFAINDRYRLLIGKILQAKNDRAIHTTDFTISTAASFKNSKCETSKALLEIMIPLWKYVTKTYGTSTPRRIPFISQYFPPIYASTMANIA